MLPWAPVSRIVAAQDGGDTNAPTTILLNNAGYVRWVFRPDSVMTRIAPDRLLAAIDENIHNK